MQFDFGLKIATEFIATLSWLFWNGAVQTLNEGY